MDTGYESESDFYGPASTVCRLRRRVWDKQPYQMLSGHTIAEPAAAEALDGVGVETKEEVKDEEPSEERLGEQLLGLRPTDDTGQRDPRHQHGSTRLGAYECQPGEAIGDFLRRLPPATTVKDERTPWIYVRNPSIGRPRRSAIRNQLVPGCEDEGPGPEGSQVLFFVKAARERLDLLRSFTDGITRMGVPGAAARRDMESARQSAARDILGLAGRLGVTCGKWMLFVRPSRVNRAWESVAGATHGGDLGIAAKVAPRDPDLLSSAGDEASRVRLVCIYTSDFRDIDDVTRVLRRLESMRLVTRQGRGAIYYKCDAYTYLGIGAGNPWGLRASLFSSSDVFARQDSMME